LLSTKAEVETKKHEIDSSYADFFNEKENMKFILYDRFLNLKSYQIYIRYIDDQFLLMKYGKLNVKELAELIKHCYQFQRGSEYNILTLGSIER